MPTEYVPAIAQGAVAPVRWVIPSTYLRTWCRRQMFLCRRRTGRFAVSALRGCDPGKPRQGLVGSLHGPSKNINPQTLNGLQKLPNTVDCVQSSSHAPCIDDISKDIYENSIDFVFCIFSDIGSWCNKVKAYRTWSICLTVDVENRTIVQVNNCTCHLIVNSILSIARCKVPEAF